MPAFRENQLARVCRAVCEAAGLDAFWLDAGPATRATVALKAKGGALSRARYAALRVAWALWNGRADASLTDVVQDCDAATLRVVAGLLASLADGSVAVDAFLVRCDAPRPPPPPVVASTPDDANDDDGYGDRNDSHAAGAWRRKS